VQSGDSQLNNKTPKENTKKQYKKKIQDKMSGKRKMSTLCHWLSVAL